MCIVVIKAVIVFARSYVLVASCIAVHANQLAPVRVGQQYKAFGYCAALRADSRLKLEAGNKLGETNQDRHHM